ncbi:MAG TPA: bifunctional riboflavin kinase/FAD synthetase [Bacteroidia bacterium]|nr:bifunctional riboflavin kinase/FAD synthetase [Bacteroidia bacterium]
MKVYNDISEFGHVAVPVLTTGTFDGVHRGHMQIISRLKESSRSMNGETVIFTFFPHPRMVLFPDHRQVLLNTLREKTAKLEEAGIDHLIIQPFTREFSMLSSKDFIEKILVEKIHTRKLVIGYDHHFGRNREGSFEHLRNSGPVYGFEVEEIPAKLIDNVSVSSTRIRHSLEKGDVESANANLGYRYPLTGMVVKGRQLGRTIGFPTANILVEDPYKLVPADGVYAVMVKRGNETHKGMLNIGMRPTVDGRERTIEVNILDFDADLYGETLTLEFVKRLRDEIKFSGLEELKKQLFADRTHAMGILENEK